MSTEAAAPAAATAPPKKSSSLDASLHVSTRASRVMSKAMSVRNFVRDKNEDLIRSGSTRQLLNRPVSSSAAGGIAPLPSLLAPIPAGPAPPAGAAESLATEQTAEDMSDSEGSDFSGGSFCEAEENQVADQDYLQKDLGASLHDDELELDADEMEAEGLINEMKHRLQIEGGPGSSKEAAAEP